MSFTSVTIQTLLHKFKQQLEGKGDKRRGEGGVVKGKGSVCFHMCELASYSGFFPVMISGEDLGNNTSVIYPPLLPPA